MLAPLVELNPNTTELSKRFKGIGNLAVWLQYKFAAIKCFGVAAGGDTFHSTKAHEGKKCVFPKPLFGPLGLKCLHEVPNFFLVDLLIQRHKYVRLPKVTVIFRNFVLQNQVIPESVPREFLDQPMILMGILAVM